MHRHSRQVRAHTWIILVWLPATPRLLMTASLTSSHVILCRLLRPLLSPPALALPSAPAAAPLRLPRPLPEPAPPAAASCDLAPPSAAVDSNFLSVALPVRPSGAAASPVSGRCR